MNLRLGRLDGRPVRPPPGFPLAVARRRQPLHDFGNEIAPRRGAGVDGVPDPVGLHRRLDHIGQVAAAQQRPPFRADLRLKARGQFVARARQPILDRQGFAWPAAARQVLPPAASGEARRSRRASRDGRTARRCARPALPPSAAFQTSQPLRSVPAITRSVKPKILRFCRAPRTAQSSGDPFGVARERAARRGERNGLAGIGRRGGRFHVMRQRDVERLADRFFELGLADPGALGGGARIDQQHLATAARARAGRLAAGPYRATRPDCARRR